MFNDIDINRQKEALLKNQTEEGEGKGAEAAPKAATIIGGNIRYYTGFPKENQLSSKYSDYLRNLSYDNQI